MRTLPSGLVVAEPAIALPQPRGARGIFGGMFGAPFSAPIAGSGAKTRYTLTLQPDSTTGIDCYIIEDQPTAERSTALYVDTDTNAGGRRLGLFYFNISVVPAAATIISATLSLWNISTAAVNRNFALNSILAANSGWVENASWNYAVPSSKRWAGDVGANGGTDAGCSVSGIDWNATALGTFSYTANNPADTQHDIALSVAQVQAWLTANQGFALRGTSDSAGFGFRSSDYADATKRPKLVVVYDA